MSHHPSLLAHKHSLTVLYGAILMVPVLVGAIDITRRVTGSDRVNAETGALEIRSGSTRTVSQEVVPLTPHTITIPQLSIKAADVMGLGLETNGAMEDPDSIYQVGWYRLGVQPGERGTAVFAAHLNNSLGIPGVFKHLDDLRLGDRITVTDKSGHTLVFRVTAETVYDVSQGLAPVLRDTDKTRIALITCEGEWDNAAGSYDKRLVVYAELEE